MLIHLQREVSSLKKRTQALCTLVEVNIGSAIRAVGTKDDKIAMAVIDSNKSIDMLRIEVEEECLKILALHQPVDVDLRFIVAVLKMVNNFKRIDDLSVNMAERALTILKPPPSDLMGHLEQMEMHACEMLRQSLDSLFRSDIVLARNVFGADDVFEMLYNDMYLRVKAEIGVKPDILDDLLQLYSIARHLNQIANLATNIAEDVIYMIVGELFLHNKQENEELIEI